MPRHWPLWDLRRADDVHATCSIATVASARVDWLLTQPDSAHRVKCGDCGEYGHSGGTKECRLYEVIRMKQKELHEKVKDEPTPPTPAETYQADLNKIRSDHKEFKKEVKDFNKFNQPNKCSKCGNKHHGICGAATYDYGPEDLQKCPKCKAPMRMPSSETCRRVERKNACTANFDAI